MPFQYFIAASALIALVLGTAHLLFTWGPKFRPRDAALMARMKEVSPKISPDLSMWEAWLSFNATHSFSAMLFGAVYGYLALAAPAFLLQSTFLLAVGAVLLAGYVALGWRYWFYVPRYGVTLAFLCYVAGLALGLR